MTVRGTYNGNRAAQIRAFLDILEVYQPDRHSPEMISALLNLVLQQSGVGAAKLSLVFQACDFQDFTAQQILAWSSGEEVPSNYHAEVLKVGLEVALLQILDEAEARGTATFIPTDVANA